MDHTQHKLYHVHGIDSRAFLDSYFSGKEDMVFEEDTLNFPMVNLHYQFSSGLIKGILLIDISIAASIHHFYSAANFFKDIVILKFNETCIMELNKWLGERSGAYDWAHTSAKAAKLDGKRDQLQDQDLKSSIRHILKCDFEQENITTPTVLPLADCVISGTILEVISKNEDEYLSNLGKMKKLLKPEGKLILLGMLDATYVTIAGHKYHVMKCNESFIKDALCKLGMVVDYCAVQRRRNVSDLVDYSAAVFIVARRGE